MKRRTATITAFLIAPLCPVIVGLMTTPPRRTEDIVVSAGLGVVVYLYALFFTALFGMPTYFLFRRLNLVRWWSAMIVGLLAGVLLGAVFRSPNHPQVSDFQLMIPSGVLVGAAFWLIWRQGKEEST